MGDFDRRVVASTIRRCVGQFARPLGVSREDVDRATELGLLRFDEWPSGHFSITDAGRNFLDELSDA